MKMLKIAVAATCVILIPCELSAQGTESLVGVLQRDGAISFAMIRNARTQQFDVLDKDRSGGLSQDEASGALSITGGRRGGAEQNAQAGNAGMTDDERTKRRAAMRERMRQGGGGGMAGGRFGGGGMSDDDRAKRREAMRQRMGQAGGGQSGGAFGNRGQGGAMAQGGNPIERMQFMSADGDFNGELSKAEFVDAPFPLLVSMDKDMDSRLTVEEIQAAPGPGRGAQGNQL